MASEVFDGVFFQVVGGRDPARNQPVTFTASADGTGPIQAYDLNGQPIELATNNDGWMQQFTANVPYGFLTCGGRTIFWVAMTQLQRLGEVDQLKSTMESVQLETATAVSAAQQAQAAAETAAEVAVSNQSGGGGTTVTSIDTTTALSAYTAAKGGTA